MNEDGKLSTSEVRNAFKKLGITVDEQEVIKLVKRMKKDGALEINFDEWRDYLLLHPTNSLKDLMTSWRHATVRHISIFLYQYRIIFNHILNCILKKCFLFSIQITFL